MGRKTLRKKQTTSMLLLSNRRDSAARPLSRFLREPATSTTGARASARAGSEELRDAESVGHVGVLEVLWGLLLEQERHFFGMFLVN